MQHRSDCLRDRPVCSFCNSIHLGLFVSLKLQTSVSSLKTIAPSTSNLTLWPSVINFETDKILYSEVVKCSTMYSKIPIIFIVALPSV